MAGGSYSQRPMPEEPTRASVPARATRHLPALKDNRSVVRTDEDEDDEKATRWLPELHPAPGITTIYQYEEHPLTRHHPWLKLLIICMVTVVLGATVLISAGIFQRTGITHLVTFPGGQSYPIQVGGSVDNVDAWFNTNAPVAPKRPIPPNPGPYSVLGKPTITVDFINQVLASYHSPAAGKGQALYDDGVKYGIDPIYALAFFMHESTFGTTGVARTTLSLGNLRCIPDRPCIPTGVNGNFAKMNSWEDGFEQWYKLIRNLYVAKWGLVTIDQIIPVYAPSSDHNDVKGYIAALKYYIDTWHAGIVRP
jgi:Mannosyl-glycoprotein endo-beta-N-acetylglucosaminidase